MQEMVLVALSPSKEAVMAELQDTKRQKEDLERLLAAEQKKAACLHDEVVAEVALRKTLKRSVDRAEESLANSLETNKRMEGIGIRRDKENATQQQTITSLRAQLSAMSNDKEGAAAKAPAKAPAKGTDVEDEEHGAAGAKDSEETLKKEWRKRLQSGGLGRETVFHLKVILKDLKLPVGGKKGDLLKRLREHAAIPDEEDDEDDKYEDEDDEAEVNVRRSLPSRAAKKNEPVLEVDSDEDEAGSPVGKRKRGAAAAKKKTAKTAKTAKKKTAKTATAPPSSEDDDVGPPKKKKSAAVVKKAASATPKPSGRPTRTTNKYPPLSSAQLNEAKKKYGQNRTDLLKKVKEVDEKVLSDPECLPTTDNCLAILWQSTLMQ